MMFALPAPDDYRGTVVGVAYGFGRVTITATRSGEDLATITVPATRGAAVRPGDSIFVEDGIVWVGPGDAPPRADIRADA